MLLKNNRVGQAVKRTQNIVIHGTTNAVVEQPCKTKKVSERARYRECNGMAYYHQHKKK